MPKPVLGPKLSPLNDIRWKIWRSQKHLEEVEANAHKFFKTDFYTVEREVDRNGRLIERVLTVEPIHPFVGILIGEVAHQLRSILDHLMWLLATPVPGREREIQFPIMSSRGNFFGWGQSRGTCHMMPGVTREVGTLVERLQPYHRRKWPETGLLGQLQIISNWDKHRTLSTSAASVEDSVSNVTITSSEDGHVASEEKFRGILEPGAILHRVTLEGTFLQGDVVNMNPERALLPVFDKRMPKPIQGAPVVATLGRTGTFIEKTVLPMFEEFL